LAQDIVGYRLKFCRVSVVAIPHLRGLWLRVVMARGQQPLLLRLK